jgi:hypothetical protein
MFLCVLEARVLSQDVIIAIRMYQGVERHLILGHTMLLLSTSRLSSLYPSCIPYCPSQSLSVYRPCYDLPALLQQGSSACSEEAIATRRIVPF